MKILFTILLWILAVLTCFAWLANAFTSSMRYSLTSSAILYLVTVAVSWCLAYPYVKSNASNKRLDDNFKLGLISFSVVPFCMAILSFSFVWAVKEVERNQFNHDHTAEILSDSNFTQLQKFAKENYNAPLELGDFDESWALTSLHIPQASPASLRSGTGYCTINISKKSMRTMHNDVRTDLNYNDWEMLILAHELLHCLDRATDVPGELGQPLKAISSIAPSDRSMVKMDDIQTFLTAEKSLKTQLWREAGADLFAIGFMSLDSKYDTAAFRSALIKYRNNRKLDTTHYTACWLEYSQSQPFPKKGSELYAWANTIRINAPCNLDI